MSEGLHNVFVDGESYGFGRGHAYQFYGVDPARGATVIVRPDGCEFIWFLHSLFGITC